MKLPWGRWLRPALVTLALALSPFQLSAAESPVDHARLVEALRASVKASGGPSNGGSENHEWASVVARDGTVCAVAFSGAKASDQWPGSRAVSMEKANTANAFSLDAMGLSTTNLFALAQPGQSLYGITTTSSPSPEAMAGDAATFGTPNDPMTGKRVGGVVVFGGGLALYNDTGVIGGFGVSGDSACADHNLAWRVRKALGLDKAPTGVSPQRKDAIVYDMNNAGLSASGFGHPKCAGREADIAEELQAGIGGASLKQRIGSETRSPWTPPN
jgi:uncharacterized protein GlcG (DUF336 family)